ncbi:MAG: hypothetical protein HZB50_07845 [Chloroflexi bacterium]|nr:hypothetical protein [Chloroflexota bacterium]
MKANWFTRDARLIGLRFSSTGVTTRFTTAATGLEDNAFTGALEASTTETAFTSDLASAFIFGLCFAIDFLDVTAFTFGLLASFVETFARTTGFDLTFAFGFALDLIAMTHILSFYRDALGLFFNGQFDPPKSA